MSRKTSPRLTFWPGALQLALATRPGRYAGFVSVGRLVGTQQIALPMRDDDDQRRYKLGEIRLQEEWGIAGGLFQTT